MTVSPFLIESPRVVHRHWWTVLPAIPSSRTTRAYHALRRVWFDHTNNWPTGRASQSLGFSVPKFFVEGLEDQLTPAVFETWSSVPVTVWGSALLSFLGAAVKGSVRRIAWSYQYEERLSPKKWSAIADIVIHWEDDGGAAVTVVEAKRPKGDIGPKDLNGDCYISIPSFARSGRRINYALLLDARDADHLRTEYPQHPHVVTWQDLLALQIEALRRAADDSVAELAINGIVTRSAHLGLRPSCGTAATTDALAAAIGTQARYAELRKGPIPRSLSELLVGLDVVLAAQQGRMPEAPHEWLQSEPDALTVQRGRGQNESDWAKPVWNLDWLKFAADPRTPS